MKKEKKAYVPPQLDVLKLFLSDCCLMQASHNGQLNQFEDSDTNSGVHEDLGPGWNDNQGWI